jgi:hypothetical protein
MQRILLHAVDRKAGGLYGFQQAEAALILADAGDQHRVEPDTASQPEQVAGNIERGAAHYFPIREAVRKQLAEQQNDWRG